MNTIQSAWDEYEKKVVPKQAGEIQRKESKLAFYSGAFLMLNHTGEIAEKYTEDQACHIIQGISDELDVFLKTVIHPKQ